MNVQYESTLESHNRLSLVNEKSAKLIANLEQQNQELEKMVKSSENDLMAQNSARENDLARLRGELDNLRIENRQLLDQTEKMKNSLKVITSERDLSQGQVHEMAIIQKGLEDDNQLLIRTRDQLTTDLDSTRAQFDLEQERVKLRNGVMQFFLSYKIYKTCFRVCFRKIPTASCQPFCSKMRNPF